jgi:hypothetical protein
MSVLKPKREPNYASRYREILTTIQNFLRENSEILDNSFCDTSYINLISVCIDPWTNDHEFYGIRKDEKGKIFFCFSSGHNNSEKGYPLSKTDLIKKLENRREHPIVTPQTLRENFLAKIGIPLQRYEMKKAKIAQKIQRTLNHLEQALED